MESSVSVDINRPLPEVFRYTNENVSDWSITVVENEVLEETPEKVGSRFRMLNPGQGTADGDDGGGDPLRGKPLE